MGTVQTSFPTIRKLSLLLAMPFILVPLSAKAQSYDDAINALLGNECTGLNGGPRDTEQIAGVGSGLNAICGASFGANPPPGSSSSSSGSGASATSAARQVVQKRIQVAREAEDAVTAGASSETVTDVFSAQGLSVFVSTGYEYLSKDETRFEDGYDSDNIDFTLGADYRVTDWLIAGLAFNYTYTAGDFDGGGDFETNRFGGLLYGTVAPIDNAFVDLVLGYAYNDLESKRQALFVDELGNRFGGAVRADYGGDEYSASAFSGYDFAVDNITFGPRAGLGLIHFDNENYTEDGDTGLELKVGGNNRTSLKSRLGVFASIAFSTDIGVIVPQFSGFWVHEYLDDQRNIDARFAQDNRPNPAEFKFKRENPERDWGELSVGVATLLPNGWQPFANVSAYVGNDRYDSYAGTLGLRADF